MRSDSHNLETKIREVISPPGDTSVFNELHGDIAGFWETTKANRGEFVSCEA